jgi:hypothetical protein
MFGHQAYKTHIKSLAMLIHGNVRVEEVHGKFTDKGSEVDMTRLESGMSFLQVKASMRMREKLMQIRSALYAKIGKTLTPG